MPGSKLPITAIITTRNEERNIARCLASLRDFDETIVVDSASEVAESNEGNNVADSLCLG